MAADEAEGQKGPLKSLSVGDIIASKYRVTGTVGKGAMGAVYKAEHVESGQHVAVKFILAADGHQDAVARFKQEAKIMANLRHPNTVRLYDFGTTDDGQMFMAMELLTGKPLDAEIRERFRANRPMTEREALEIGLQILRSLAEAHGQGLVHRDLKPGNVFLADDGSGEMIVKVLDFGIARVEDSELTQQGQAVGTPAYMSPEQWRAEKDIDARSDLYAVGAILYCCLVGKAPFPADKLAVMLAKVMSEPAPDVRTMAQGPVTDGMAEIIAVALRKLPEERFADAKAMRGALESVLGGAWAGTPAFSLSQTGPKLKAGGVPSAAPTNAGPVSALDATLALNTGTIAASKSKAPLMMAISVAVLLLVGSAFWLMGGGKKVEAAAAPTEPAAVAPVPAAVPLPAVPVPAVPVQAVPVVAGPVPATAAPVVAPAAVAAPAQAPVPTQVPVPSQEPESAPSQAKPEPAKAKPAAPAKAKPAAAKKGGGGAVIQSVD